jgi:hypothetical protein
MGIRLLIKFTMGRAYNTDLSPGIFINHFGVVIKSAMNVPCLHYKFVSRTAGIF